MSRRLAMFVNRVAAVAAVLCVVFAGVVSVASAAQAAKAAPLPAATASALVTGNDVTITVEVAAAPSKIPGATCVLDATTIPCGAPTAVGTKASRYTITRTAVAAGSHSFVFNIWVGTASSHTLAPIATATFEVAPPTLEGLCTSLGGAYTAGFTSWYCAFPREVSMPQSPLTTRCWAEGGIPRMQTTSTTAAIACAWPGTVQAINLCTATRTGGYDSRFLMLDSGPNSRWTCTTNNPSVAYEPFRDACTVTGGVWYQIPAGTYQEIGCAVPPPT